MENGFDWMQLLNPKFYIELELWGVPVGLYVVLFIVFAETGLFAGFFLPGDSLLFLAGIFSDALMATLFDFGEHINVATLSLLVGCAGIVGNTFGYWFGARSGNYLYKRKDSFLFKKKYLIQSEEFFHKHGGRAIIYARFLPILRTFAPIVAGVVKMDKKKFMFYNIISSFAWAFALIYAGHYLSAFFLKQFNVDLKENIELIIIGIIVISTAPLLLNALKGNKVTEQEAKEEAEDNNDDGQPNIFPN
jgi:membrane-associated protein